MLGAEMDLSALVATARKYGASDLHLEAGRPSILRVRGELRSTGEPIPAEATKKFARGLLPGGEWERFLERRSADLATTFEGVRCRVHVLTTARGVGLAVRLLSDHQPTLRSLNLHPVLAELVGASAGLVLVSGATGSGKSSTLAALVHEVAETTASHVVTIEHPVEFHFRPKKSLVRQREVGRDTPSFEQAILDAMREDPDVLVVGEMRDPSTMRLTLQAAETGHLVLSTAHASTCGEALDRIASSFPAEIRSAVLAQLADVLLGVVCQHLVWRPDLSTRVPECEILRASTGVKSLVRQGQFFKIPGAMDTGGADGQWTLARYRSWMAKKKDWSRPSSPDREPFDAREPPRPAERPAGKKPAPPKPGRATGAPDSSDGEDQLVIDLDAPPDDISDILSELDEGS